MLTDPGSPSMLAAMDIRKRRSDAYRRASQVSNTESRQTSSSDARPGESEEADGGLGQSASQNPVFRGADSRRSSSGRSGQPARAIAGDPVDRTHSTDARPKKVAKLLMLLGRDEAARVLEHLGEEEVEAVMRQIAETRTVDSESAGRILAEFGFQMESRPAVGGRDTALSILRQAFGKDEAELMLSRALGERRRFFGFLGELEARQVRALIKDESPAVVAVILGHMETEAAASVLSVLADKTRTAVIRRMAGSGEIEGEVLERVEASLRRKIELLARVDTEGPDGRSTLAEILRHMDHSKEASLLDSLQAEDAELVADIEDRLFTIETLLLIDDRQLAEVLVRYEDRDLALMLKGKDEEIRRKVLSGLSERRRAAVAEDYRFLGAVPQSEVEEATGTLLADLRRLESEGSLVVRREGERYI